MGSSLRALIDLLGRPDFHAGLLAATGAWLIANLWSTSRRGWGIALTAATIGGVNVAIAQRLSTALGLVILGVGGAFLERRIGTTDDTNWGPWLAIVAGAIVASSRGGVPDTAWIQMLTPVVIVVSGYWLTSWSELPQRRLLGPLVLITAFGVWATVPDTDAARVLLGASAVLAPATFIENGLRIAAVGAFPLAGTFVWIAAAGGEGRHGSIVGAWACVGLLLLLPLLVDRARALPDWLVLSTHTLVVLISSRVLGRFDAAAPAAVGVLALAGVTYLLLRAYTANSTQNDFDSH